MRKVLVIAGLSLAVAPAAFAFFAEASHDRTVAFLEDVRAAQEQIRFAGRKIVESPEGRSVYDVRADRPGRVHAVAVERPSGRRGGPGSGRGPRGRFTDPALIAENYRLEPLAAERIAGREVDRYALLSRHKGRASYEFAVDRRNRFMLAFRAVSRDGASLYDSRFESIDFDPAPRADEKPATPRTRSARPSTDRPRFFRQKVIEEDLRLTMPFIVWRPAWTPPGFKLRNIERYVLRDKDEAILYRWSDGMVGLHLIQTDAGSPAWELFRGYLGLPELPPKDAGNGDPVAWRMRHPGGALLDLTLEGTEVLIGGQVDSDELKKIADHLKKID